MKLSIGVPDYEFNPAGEMKSALILGRKPGRDIPLIRVSWPDMARMRRGSPWMRAIPRYVSYGRFDEQAPDRLWFYPMPDGEYEVVLVSENAKPIVAPGTLAPMVTQPVGMPKASTITLPHRR